MLQIPCCHLWNSALQGFRKRKISGLKYHKGNFEGKIRLSAKAKAEIQWSINYNDSSCNHINIPNTDITIYNNASLTGRGITNRISPPRDSGIRQS